MRPPFFAFYPADFANDLVVEAMSTLQVGAYMLLLCKAWQGEPPASLPNNDQALARLARVDAVVWAEIKAGVLAPFHVGADGRLHSKRLRREYDTALRLMKKKRSAGQAGADARWGGKLTTGGKVDGRRIADALPAHSDGNAIQSQIEKKKEETKTPLPPAKPGGGTDAPTPDFDPSAEPEIVTLEPFAALVAAWKAAGLPGHDKLIEETSNRRGHWQNRLREDSWRERWREALARASRSRVCRGEDAKFMVHGLRLDTFLQKPDMLVRLLEGEFDDVAGPRLHQPGGGNTDDAKAAYLAGLAREKAEKKPA